MDFTRPAALSLICRACTGVCTQTYGSVHLTVHLPEGWHREHEWMNLFTATCGPPAAAP